MSHWLISPETSLLKTSFHRKISLRYADWHISPATSVLETATKARADDSVGSPIVTSVLSPACLFDRTGSYTPLSTYNLPLFCVYYYLYNKNR